MKDNEREIGGRIGEKRRRGGRRGCAPQARMRKGGVVEYLTLCDKAAALRLTVPQHAAHVQLLHA